MNRLQKKCFIASITAHLALLGIAFFGSALMPAPKAPDFTPITMIDPNLVTDAKTSGGNPNVVATPPAAPTPAPAPAPAPPATPPPTPPAQPQVEQPEIPKPQETKVKPEVRDPVPLPRSKTGDEPTKSKPPKTTFTADELKLVKGPRSKPPKPSDQTDLKAQQEQERRNQIAKQIGRSVRSLGNGLSSSTAVEMPQGPGDGGPAAQNYRDIVASIYTDAWAPPADLDDEMATVIASITIDREGNVVSAHITKRSGNASMDHSIQNTLEKVTFITPFPPGAKEQQRTYNIKFNLQAKRSVG